MNRSLTTAPTNEMLALADELENLIVRFRDDQSTVDAAVEALRLSATTSARDMREALDNSQSLLVMLHHVDSDAATWKHEGIEELLKEQISQNRSALSNLDAAAPAAGGDADRNLEMLIRDIRKYADKPVGSIRIDMEDVRSILKLHDEAALQAPSHSDAVREAVEQAAECFRTAKELRDNSRGNCNAIEQAIMWERKAVKAIAALTAPAAKAPAVSEADVGRIKAAIAPCKGEQYKFEDWAKSQRYDMTEHPLHYIFMDTKTKAARMGWKAALEYVERIIGGTESEATGKRPIPSVSLSSQGEQERDTLGVTAGREPAPFPSDSPSQEASAPKGGEA